VVVVVFVEVAHAVPPAALVARRLGVVLAEVAPAAHAELAALVRTRRKARATEAVGVEVLDTLGNISIAGRLLPVVAGSTDFMFSFADDFTPGLGKINAADFTSVKRITVWFWLKGDPAADSLVVSLIEIGRAHV